LILILNKIQLEEVTLNGTTVLFILNLYYMAYEMANLILVAL